MEKTRNLMENLLLVFTHPTTDIFTAGDRKGIYSIPSVIYKQVLDG